jgi:hypothetical protein
MHPESPSSDISQVGEQSRHERGGCLITWLSVAVFSGLFGIYLFVDTLNFFISNGLTSRSDLMIPLFLLGIDALVIFVCLWGIWTWRRWGVYGFVIFNFAGTLIGVVFVQNNPMTLFTPILQTAILYLLVKDKWRAFE